MRLLAFAAIFSFCAQAFPPKGYECSWFGELSANYFKFKDCNGEDKHLLRCFGVVVCEADGKDDHIVSFGCGLKEGSKSCDDQTPEECFAQRKALGDQAMSSADNKKFLQSIEDLKNDADYEFKGYQLRKRTDEEKEKARDKAKHRKGN